MKIIIAPDTFKGSLTATQAAEAIAAGIHDHDPSIETLLFPVADGGEGTVSTLVSTTGGEIVSAVVHDPLGRKIEASYGILGDGKTCVIEIAEASGLTLLESTERNPLKASTFGTGELMLHALNSGYRNFIIGLGGSATNDGGVGMLQALGMKFINEQGTEIQSGGGELSKIRKIDDAQFDNRIPECHFVIASDVTNPLIGPNGASAIFGPQKGATMNMVEILDNNLSVFADIVEKFTGHSLHNQKGAGAAGGAGGALLAFFPSEMRRGIEVVLASISFEEHFKDADLIITGEGKTDKQTLSGKTALGIAQVANETPVILISGAIDKDSRSDLLSQFIELHAVVDETVSIEQSMTEAFSYLRAKTRKVIKDYLTKA